METQMFSGSCPPSRKPTPEDWTGIRHPEPELGTQNVTKLTF